MSYRRQSNKPTTVLWVLVALADVALVLASAGALVLISLMAVAAVAVAATFTWRRLDRAGARRVPVPVAVRIPARYGERRR